MMPEVFLSIRQRLGLTQQDLAKLLGVSQRAVQYYEAGSRKVPGPVARILGLMEKENAAAQS